MTTSSDDKPAIERPPPFRLTMFNGGLAYYYISSIIVVVGVWFGHDFLPPQPSARLADSKDGVVARFAAWDGRHYIEIVRDGYGYKPERRSNVAFFPAFPALGRLVVHATGWTPDIALLCVSHVNLIACFVALAAYMTCRFPDATSHIVSFTRLAFGLWPMTLFFRMTYTESLFVLTLIVALYGMAAGWRPIGVAVVVGFATAVRPVGVAAVLPFAWWLYRRSDGARSFTIRGTWLLPIACWGILAYMLYLQLEFGDALAFVKTQSHWAVRENPPWPRHLLALLTGEPLWSVYLPSSEAYWARFDTHGNPLVSLHFFNPIFFATTAGLVIYGAWKNWLTTEEWLLSAGLLLIPYISHSYRTVMMAEGRYAAAAFPVYLVMGRLLAKAPPPVAAVCCAFGGCLLLLYSALFAAWYRVI